MNYQIVISGVGGQGVLFITRLLAQACMEQGLNVLTSETHGMAQRGGTVISHLKAGTFSSPLIRPGKADLLVALKQENYAQHRGFLAAGGKAVVNAPAGCPGLEGAVCLDASALAGSAGNPGAVNLFMLGGALALLPVCPMAGLKDQVRLAMAKRGDGAFEKAAAALEAGFSCVAEGV
jgi:indolepyruvate ferredoxin oxidoreductase beta subunit